MGALGYTLQTPEEEKFLETRDELIAQITTFMGGRAAEDLVFNVATSGAANDIEKATNIARNMVTRFGMSDKFGMMGLATVESQYLDGRASMMCAEQTASQVDDEVLAIITECYNRAKDLLTQYRNVLDEISDFLYQKETITGKEFMQMFRDLTGILGDEEHADGDTQGTESTPEDDRHIKPENYFEE
jgi:cell division protease FtsH